jgi:hypothetical protein
LPFWELMKEDDNETDEQRDHGGKVLQDIDDEEK